MTAAALIRELADTGIRLSANGDRLHVEARRGALTEELRKVLTANKTDLIAALSGADDTRSRLVRLAKAGNRDPALVDRIAPADLPAYAGMTDTQLIAALSMLADGADRERGIVPKGDTAAILCRSCGPVWVDPATAGVLPVVGGWPRAIGCPWCFIRARGIAFPRPHVACAECRHYKPDPLNPAGMGRCCGDDGATWPRRKHRCERFRPVGDP